jgi:hypothetical protein
VSLLELSGTMKWSVILSVFDWDEVMVASVDQYEDFRPVRKSRKEDFLPHLKNGLLCWKSAA